MDSIREANTGVDPTWALVLQKMNGDELPSGFCYDCANRRTERCPMRFSVWVGSYSVDFDITDNTVDMGYCFKWQAKGTEHPEETEAKPQ